MRWFFKQKHLSYTSTKPNGIIRKKKKKNQNKNGINNKNLPDHFTTQIKSEHMHTSTKPNGIKKKKKNLTIGGIHSAFVQQSQDQVESQNCNPALPSSWRWFDKYGMHSKHKNTQQNQRRLLP